MGPVEMTVLGKYVLSQFGPLDETAIPLVDGYGAGGPAITVARPRTQRGYTAFVCTKISRILGAGGIHVGTMSPGNGSLAPYWQASKSKSSRRFTTCIDLDSNLAAERQASESKISRRSLVPDSTDSEVEPHVTSAFLAPGSEAGPPAPSSAVVPDTNDLKVEPPATSAFFVPGSKAGQI